MRERAGVFDVSHMGQIKTRGPQATELLQRLLSNDLRKLPKGGAQYSVICREDGGVLDDVITYRLAECEYLTVSNAANHERDLAWFSSHARRLRRRRDRPDRPVRDARGPGPEGARRSCAGSPMARCPPKRASASDRWRARRATICGTGYTGEDGVELLLDPADAPAVWDALIAAGAVPAGLGARDTLRLEACLPLYGNELTEERGPIEAGLGWCCAEATGFIGSDAVAARADIRRRPRPETGGVRARRAGDRRGRATRSTTAGS